MEFPKKAAKVVRDTDLSRPRVCLDLDGVLAKYEGWKGPDHIGTLLPGALEFAWSLAQFADIVIFTSRCSMDTGRGNGSAVDPGRMRIKIIDWLEKYKFPYSDVYVGHGKARAAAFIGDRAVSCRPQSDKATFEKALAPTKAVLSNRSRKPAPDKRRLAAL